MSFVYSSVTNPMEPFLHTVDRMFEAGSATAVQYEENNKLTLRRVLKHH